MDHFRLFNIGINWVKIYLFNYFTYLLVLATHWATNRKYKFEFEDDTHSIKLNMQNLDTLLYIYEEELNVGMAERIDRDYMEEYRKRYLARNKLHNIIVLNNNNEMLTIDRE